MKKKQEAAEAHLRRVDARLANVIERVGPCRLRPNRDRFGMLVRSIISQQVSTRAAATIRDRLIAKAGALTPEAIEKLSDEELRSVGVSPQKSRYIRDLVGRTLSGELELSRMGRLKDEEVITHLIAVKGIGWWKGGESAPPVTPKPPATPKPAVDLAGLERSLREAQSMADLLAAWQAIPAPHRAELARVKDLRKAEIAGESEAKRIIGSTAGQGLFFPARV